MKKLLFASIFVIGCTLWGCNGSAKEYPVVLVDRNVAFSLDDDLDPLRLVVEIAEDGRLRLNKIETGTMADLTVLTGKLTVIFEDRRTAGIDRREVMIDPQGDVRKEDLDKLIRSLAEASSSPIRVIETSPSRVDLE